MKYKTVYILMAKKKTGDTVNIFANSRTFKTRLQAVRCQIEMQELIENKIFIVEQISFS